MLTRNFTLPVILTTSLKKFNFTNENFFRHLEVLYYAFKRICKCRAAQPNEKREIALININAGVLEFFEDFYSGFLHILLQTYILMLQIEDNFQTKFCKKIRNFLQ